MLVVVVCGFCIFPRCGCGGRGGCGLLVVVVVLCGGGIRCAGGCVLCIHTASGCGLC